MSGELHVLFGTATGTAQLLSGRLGSEAISRGWRVSVSNLSTISIKELPQCKKMIFLISTFGLGEFPDDSKAFWKAFSQASLPHDFLEGTRFTVFGLGDSTWPDFQYCPRLLQRRCVELGAKMLFPCGEGDDRDVEGVHTEFLSWMRALFVSLEYEMGRSLAPYLQYMSFLPALTGTQLPSTPSGDARRIEEHPVLPTPPAHWVGFTWNSTQLRGREGEALSSALVANGINVLGHHHKDNSPQGLFCANGQCSQCTVVCDGVAVKSCMTSLREGMRVESRQPSLPPLDDPVTFAPIPKREVPVLIIGGGPAGMAAANQLARAGIRSLIIDDKDRLGGKLVLQTHKFFGSVEDCHAGTRGFRIAEMLAEELRGMPEVEVWLRATAVGVFSDGYVGVAHGNEYALVKPQRLMVAAGAREKMITFPGNSLPGVYGAGAFQTLVNRDLVRSSKRVLIVGGGNVGLIAGYHAIQAGITVVALVEALPECGGYKVHADKLARLGVPILTRHTVVSVNGKDHVESVTIGKLDPKWQIVPGSELTYEVDTVLIAVGLSEVNEFVKKAQRFHIPVWAAGDANEIAEASSAMFSGRIAGLNIAQSMGRGEAVPAEWDAKAKVLAARPGPPKANAPCPDEHGCFPVLHCFQEIPCNACTSVCPSDLIQKDGPKITDLPKFIRTGDPCVACFRCVAICPGLATTVVDYRQDPERPLVTFPFEIGMKILQVGDEVDVMSETNTFLGRFPVAALAFKSSTVLVSVQLPKAIAKAAAAVWRQPANRDPIPTPPSVLRDETIVCRCERVTAGELRELVRSGVRDMNKIKQATRCGMGACGGKCCELLTLGTFRQEKVDMEEVVGRVPRPLTVEVSLGQLAGVQP